MNLKNLNNLLELFFNQYEIQNESDIFLKSNWYLEGTPTIKQQY